MLIYDFLCSLVYHIHIKMAKGESWRYLLFNCFWKTSLFLGKDDIKFTSMVILSSYCVHACVCMCVHFACKKIDENNLQSYILPPMGLCMTMMPPEMWLTATGGWFKSADEVQSVTIISKVFADHVLWASYSAECWVGRDSRINMSPDDTEFELKGLNTN